MMMHQVLLVIHVLLAVSLVGIVLLQRSEGGGLGLGGSGGGMSGFMTARGTANLLTRTTAILAALFIVTSITLTILARSGGERKSILDGATPAAPVSAPATPATPAAPAGQENKVPVGP